MGRYWMIFGATISVMAVYVGLAAAQGDVGYPLDDAWIHQTYARNLVRTGQWEFVPGVVSAGSTSPLWTLLLAVGYLANLPHFFWSYLLGGVCLFGVAVAGIALWRQLWPGLAGRDWLAGLALVGTWPLIWAAASGMETLLFVALGLGLLAAYGRLGWEHPLHLGLLGGLLILTRPDGLLPVLLLATALGGKLLTGNLSRRRWLLTGARFAAGLALPLVPYFLFNLRASGTVWPNTFYAKQVEYTALLAEPLVSRFARLLTFSVGGPESGWRGISGAHLVLLAGLLAASYRAVRHDWKRRQLSAALPLLWGVGHVALYAWRLPVTYQHGRYLLAALPVWVLYGLAGWLLLLDQPSLSRVARLLRPTVVGVYASLLLIFLALGGQQYANDVAFINGEMVAVAHWIRDNTPPEAVIAAHDIGAIGYFAERPLLDLAGLVSPEVTELLADEPALAAYILASPARYLVTAPGWPYLSLTAGRVPLHSTDYAWTRAQGFNNMAVFTLPAPD